MPFFISKKKLEDIERVAEVRGYQRAKDTHGKATISAGGFVAGPIKIDDPKGLSAEDLKNLLTLVPGLKKYTYLSFLGTIFFDKEKIRKRSADLAAHEAAERGRKIALTLAGDTADYAKALKEEGE